MAAKRKVTPPAPALIRTGMYQALGGAVLVGAVALVGMVLNPPKKVSKSAGGCGCGCSGASTAAKVYG
ncbi:hypothetical protein ACFFLM_21295 [Deinococcus oregonensis]|uniref:FeoB-associated Cys-rich membrane protein n=1 Tax=Deinococcus oregonensis TaxID=1805970 RepID=A0ABV6B6L2_9DEIO